MPGIGKADSGILHKRLKGLFYIRTYLHNLVTKYLCLKEILKLDLLSLNKPLKPWSLGATLIRTKQKSPTLIVGKIN